MAVAGDSSDAPRMRWRRRLDRDPNDRLATLGLAVLAHLTYQDSVAARLYGSLLGSPGAPPDRVGGYAANHFARLLALRGHWPRADSLAERGVAAGRAAADSSLTGEALVTLGSVRHRTLGPAAALALVTQAESILPVAEYRVRGMAACVRAQALSLTGDPHALDAALSGAELAGRARDSQARAGCLGVAAADLARRGDVDSALALYGSLVGDYRRARDRAGLAVALQWRSYQYRQIGWLAQAKRDAEEAITEGDASGVRVVIPWAHATLASVALALSDPTGAAPHAAEATRAFEAQRDQYALTMARQLEGDLAVAAGDWAGSRPAYADALARARTAGWVESEIGLHEALMHVALREGDLAAAGRELAATRELARTRRMTGFLNTTEYYRGLLALRAGRLGEAEARFRSQAPAALAAQPNWRYLISARLAEVLVRQGRFDAAERELAAASAALDEWRATLRDRELRLLALQLAEDRSDPDLAVATVIAALSASGRGNGAFALVERQRARDLADRLNRIATLDPATGDRAVRTAPPLTASGVMATVPDDSTAILEYVVGGGDEPTTLFVITRRELQSYVLPPEDSLAPSVARFAVLLESGADARALGRELGTALLAPALDRLHPAVRRLVVVPDGTLHRLPFDALVLPDGRYAVERFAIATAPSATIAARLWEREISPHATGVLVLADPRFAAATRPPSNDGAFRSAVAGGAGLPRLRGSAREARAVARFAPEATVRRRGDASEAWLKHASLTGYGVVHFATHALVDDASVANTALALAPGDGDDGFVGSAELAQLHLAAELVVLSACRTAGGVLLRGEGVQGLAAPLLSAGARAVAVTWWPVGDEGLVRLVSDFYAAMAAGGPAADALRDAKLAALRRGAPAREWAAFTLVGDPLAWPPMLAAPADRSWMIVGLAAALGLLATYGIARRKRRASERA